MKNFQSRVSTTAFALALPLITGQVHAQTDITAYGTNALMSNTTGDENSAFGVNALRSNTTASHNTAAGRGAMYKNTTGWDNTAVGVSALYFNTSGLFNVAVGMSALESNTTGQANIAIGKAALFSNTTALHNTAVGHGAMYYNSTGELNTALGSGALNYNEIGEANTAVGHQALLWSEGDYNTAVGDEALFNNVTGDFNTAIGVDAGPSSGALNNTGAFGYNAQVTASNTIRIGNSSITQIGGSVAWSNLSDGRYKTNIRQNVPGVEFITKLRPVTFNWDIGKLNENDGLPAFASDAKLGEAREAKARKVYTGFIAQDVETAAEQCGFDFSGVVKPANESSQYQLAYSEFVVPLVQAVQEQQREIEALRETVKGLSSSRSGGVLGSHATETRSRHAGILGDSFGAAMALLSAVLVMLHLKRRTLRP